MSTYATMFDRIADESRRTDLTAQIKLCIQEAIAHYEVERFWFNLSRSNTFDTVASQEFYSSSDNAYIDEILELDTLNITVNSNRYVLEPTTWEQIDRWSVLASSIGQPTRYCYWAQQIRLYPIPDAAYTVRMQGLFRLSTLSANDDTNAWMVEGERLIRSRASGIFYRQYLRNDVAAARHDKVETEEYAKLMMSIGRRMATGTIQPSL